MLRLFYTSPSLGTLTPASDSFTCTAVRHSGVFTRMIIKGKRVQVVQKMYGVIHTVVGYGLSFYWFKNKAI